MQENWEAHERVKGATLLKELDGLSQGIKAAADRKLCKETETRMGILCTTLKKVEASINESEGCLEESQMREEEAHQGDWGESDSSEEQDRDVIVEEEQESGPTDVEAPDLPASLASVQAAEPSMDVDMEDVPLLTSEEATAVTPEEDEVLTGDPASVAGEMARLQVTSPDSLKP